MLKDIINFFNGYDFNDQEFEISQCEKTNNLKKLVETHISFLENNRGNKIYLPYYTRLEKIYLKLKK